MAYLFDTDAISEVLRRQPLEPYLDWLGTVPREEQFASAVTVGELYKGAYRSQARALPLELVSAGAARALRAAPLWLKGIQAEAQST